MDKNIKDNKKMIPELRFPEFVNEGEWDEKFLGNICVVTNGKSNAQDHVENGKYPMFDRSEVIKASNDFIFDCEAVIIPGEGMRFVPKYYKGKFNLHQRAYALKDFTCNGQFVYFSMLQRSSLLSQKAVQSTVLSLRLPILQNFPIEIPPKPHEQQKIASCLTSLDELISAHSKKLEALKEHKKGMMQNLFPNRLNHDLHDEMITMISKDPNDKKSFNQVNQKNHSADNVPKYRFPEFVNDGEWEEKPLKEVFSIFQGFAFSSEDSVSNGTRWLKIADVGLQQMKDDNPTFLPLNYKDQYQRFLVKKQDYVLALTRPILNMELKIAPVDQKFHNALLNQRVGKIVTSNSSSFVYYLLHTTEMVENINKNIAGNEPPNLSFQQIEDIEIYLPKKIEEQQKIAECLSSLDDLLKAQAEKIEQLKLHKKGLMQGLFPSITN